MIPKVIHHIWIGNNEPTEFEQACRASVIKLHPDWVFTRWNFRTDRDPGVALNDDFQRLFDQPQLKSIGSDLMAFCKSIEGYTGRHDYRAIQSDLVRVCLLYLYGGIYLDWDMYGTRPLDRFLNDDLVIGAIKPGLVGEAIIGSPAGSEHLYRLIAGFAAQKPEKGYCSLRLWEYADAFGLPYYSPEYFNPHLRIDQEGKYRVTTNTHTIHCWANGGYDLKRLEAIADSANKRVDAKIEVIK